MVAGPYHGFGGHQEAIKTIHCGVVPKQHRHGSFVLQLKAKIRRVKSKCIISLLIKKQIDLKHPFHFIYLFVGAGSHVSAHVKMSRRVNKHHLERIVEFCQRWLQGESIKQLKEM